MVKLIAVIRIELNRIYAFDNRMKQVRFFRILNHLHALGHSMENCYMSDLVLRVSCFIISSMFDNS